MAHYKIMEHFYTLQGEGAYTGQAAYFVRLAGCDVGCVWCDVKESWDATQHNIMTTEEIVEKICEAKATIAVITGGEPLMQNCNELTHAIRNIGIKTNLETSAAYPFSGHWDWVCISPKKFKTPLPENMKYANELKIIVFNKSDFAWAENFASQVNNECLLFLQPEWDKEKEITPLIIDYIKKNPKWKLSLQTHKYLNIP